MYHLLKTSSLRGIDSYRARWRCRVLQRLATSSTIESTDDLRAKKILENHGLRFNFPEVVIERIKPYYKTSENLNDKLNYFKERLELSLEQTQSLIAWQPMLLTKSKEELDERIDIFRNTWRFPLPFIQNQLSSKLNKKIQLQTNKEITEMFHIYRETFKLPIEKLPEAIENHYYWDKYQKHLQKFQLKSSDNLKRKYLQEKHSFYRKLIILYFERFGIKTLSKGVVNEIIRLQIFENAQKEQKKEDKTSNPPKRLLKDKIDYLIETLQLNENELKLLLSIAPSLLNNSLLELKQKVSYLQEKLLCSTKEEIRYFFFKKSRLMILPINIIENQHNLLLHEYEFNNRSEDIKKLFQSKYNFHQFPNMIQHFIERKYIFNLMITNPLTLLRNAMFHPSLLSISPEKLYFFIDAYSQGLGIQSLDEMSMIFNYNGLLLNPYQVKEKCQQALALLLKPDEQLSSKLFIIPEIIASKEFTGMQIEFEKKYQLSEVLKAFPQTPDKEEGEDEEDDSGAGGDDEINHEDGEGEGESRRNRKSQAAAEIYPSFAEAKKSTLLHGINAKEVIDLSEIAMGSDKTNRTVTPYSQYLLEIMLTNQVNLLDSLGGFNLYRKALSEAVMRGFGANGIEIEKDQAWLAISLIAAKEVEKVVFSVEKAKEICLRTSFVSMVFTSTLKKMICLTVSLQLTAEELMSIISRVPSTTYHSFDDNTLPKLLLFASVANNYIKEAYGSKTLTKWKKSLQNSSFTLEEGRRHHRNHPVIAVVREWVLQDPFCLKLPYDKLETGLKKWEQLPIAVKSTRSVMSFVPRSAAVKRPLTDEEELKEMLLSSPPLSSLSLLLDEIDDEDEEDEG